MEFQNYHIDKIEEIVASIGNKMALHRWILKFLITLPSMNSLL